MRFRLIPRDEGFYPLFEAGATNALAGARELQMIFKQLPISQAEVDRIVALERKGDEITREIMGRLNRALVTPFDREDIYKLADRMDDTLDDMRAAADSAYLHQVDGTLPGLDELTNILVLGCEATERLMRKLRSLRDLDTDLDIIDKLESDGDAANRKTVAELFSGRYEALDVLKWKDVIERVEQGINALEGVSQIISSIAIKHA
jgi:uncharacterized protein